MLFKTCKQKFTFFYVLTVLKSICNKTTAKNLSALSKIVFLTWRQLFAVHFLLKPCTVCPVMTPEFFLHNTGIHAIADKSMYSAKQYHYSHLITMVRFLGKNLRLTAFLTGKTDFFTGCPVHPILNGDGS